jgi:hypothetical protein
LVFTIAILALFIVFVWWNYFSLSFFE